MGMEEAQKLSLSIKDAFDYPRRCPACPLLNKKAWRRRGHLLKHLTSKVHDLTLDAATLLLSGNGVPKVTMVSTMMIIWTAMSTPKVTMVLTIMIPTCLMDK